MHIQHNPVRFTALEKIGTSLNYFRPTSAATQQYGWRSTPATLLQEVISKGQVAHPAIVAGYCPAAPGDKPLDVFLASNRHGALQQTVKGPLSRLSVEKLDNTDPKAWTAVLDALLKEMGNIEKTRRKTRNPIPMSQSKKAWANLTNGLETLCFFKVEEPVREFMIANPADKAGWMRKEVRMKDSNPGDPLEQQLLTRYGNWRNQLLADLAEFNDRPGYAAGVRKITAGLDAVEQRLKTAADIVQQHYRELVAV